jgi:outer membrane autotransporter protein
MDNLDQARGMKMRRRNNLLSAFIIVLQLLLMSLSIFVPGPVAAQVSPVPPGLVLPIGNAIRTWESGATDFSTPNSVNRILSERYAPPYYASFPPNQGIPEIMPSQPLYFVRFYTGNDPRGPWIMRAAEVRGLSPQQIQNRFALPAVPTNITIVVVPANTVPLWTGIAGPITQFNASGGGHQSFIMSHLQRYPDYSSVENINWPFIPSENYLHGEPIGAQALLYKPTVGSGNAGSVAAYLDQFIPQPYSDQENVYILLDYLNYVGYGSGPLRNAMRQISPERYDTLPTLGLRADLLFGNALMQRSQALRLGLGGGPAKSGVAEPEDLERLAQLVCISNSRGPQLISPAVSQSSVSTQGFGVWARGAGEFGNQGSFGERTGFSYNTGGLVGGIDWQPRQDVILGFGAAYLGTGLSWNQDGGNGSVHYAKFGLYGSYFTPRWFVDGVFSGGVNWTATTRNIIIGSDSPLMPVVNRQANGNQTGHDLSLQGRLGVNVSLWNWYLTPMAGLAYFYLHQDAFTESGSNGLNLNVQANEAQTLRSTLGARLAKTFTTSRSHKITPEAQAGWAHNFALDNRVINASLAELGGAFATRGFNGDTDSFLVGAGLTTQLQNGLSLSAHYGAEIGWGFSYHTVNLGLRFNF